MPLQKYADTRFELRNLVTGKRIRMSGIMRCIMDCIRVRKSSTDNNNIKTTTCEKLDFNNDEEEPNKQQKTKENNQ